MDHEDNCNTEIQLDIAQQVIELRLERKNDEVEFTAGKRIRIQNFEELVNTCILNGSVGKVKLIREITWLYADTLPPIILTTPPSF